MKHGLHLKLCFEVCTIARVAEGGTRTVSADGMALARCAHRNKRLQMSATALKTKTATTKASRDKRTGCQVWGKAPETERANGIFGGRGRV